ncbi:MAG: hypothetical protein LUC45_04950, partial [Paraprevotella sp.]|nr:hypothetical protein [Paraprevotella sp.]
PSAWVDWQYMEEDNDQWCLVEGNFMTQDYHKVKNFSIRQHFSRFIQPGYTYLATQNGQTLAARNPEGDSLIIVVLNPTALPVTHQADLSFYSSVNGDITALRTSETEDLVATNDYTLEDRMLTYRLPAYSITTYLIPVTEAPEADNAILPDKSYWICPRNAADQSIQASDGQVTLQPIGYNAEQIWQLHSAGKGYTFINKAGYILTDRSPQYALDCEKQTETGQTFLLSPIHDIFQKISTEDESKSLDLQAEH